MEPRPVSSSKTPSYPTRRDVLAGAATLAACALAGRFMVVAEGPKDPPSGRGGASSSPGALVVAPLFVHGEGRGAVGCVMVSPPVFLSEEEGMQIIREELAKHGIDLKPGGVLAGVRVPHRRGEFVEVKGPGGTSLGESIVVDPEATPEPLELDGVDAARKVGVEFVCHEDYSKRGGPERNSSLQEFNFKEVAQYVGTLATKQGTDPLYLGIFYDPSPRITLGRRGANLDWDTLRKLGEENSRELLRLQAQDFLAWLKEKKAL